MSNDWRICEDVGRRGTIICATHAGLANRLKCLTSTMRIGSKTGRYVKIHWPANEKCAASFGDLFTNPLPEVDVVPCGRLFDRYQFLEEKCAADVIILHTWRFALTDIEWKETHQTLDFAYERCHLNGSIAVHISATLRSLHPVEAIRNDVVEFCNEHFDDHVVGVHVRRADHTISRTVSTDAAFRDLMHRQLEYDREARFFLATDAVDVERNLGKEFPGRVFSFPKHSTDRSDPHSIRTALTDLLILSRVRRLFGSKSSTFTELAWWWGCCQPIVIAGEAPPSGFWK